MTSEEMRQYLERLAVLREDIAVTPQVRLDVASDDPQRLRRVHTNGLAQLGLPELFVEPPPDYRPPSPSDWAGLAFLLACALVTLAGELAEDLSVAPVEDQINGRSVRLWLAGPEPPDAALAEALGLGVGLVIRVECSLWADEPP